MIDVAVKYTCREVIAKHSEIGRELRNLGGRAAWCQRVKLVFYQFKI